MSHTPSILWSYSGTYSAGGTGWTVIVPPLVLDPPGTVPTLVIQLVSGTLGAGVIQTGLAFANATGFFNTEVYSATFAANNGNVTTVGANWGAVGALESVPALGGGTYIVGEYAQANFQMVSTIDLLAGGALTIHVVTGRSGIHTARSPFSGGFTTFPSTSPDIDLGSIVVVVIDSGIDAGFQIVGSKPPGLVPRICYDTADGSFRQDISFEPYFMFINFVGTVPSQPTIFDVQPGLTILDQFVPTANNATTLKSFTPVPSNFHSAGAGVITHNLVVPEGAYGVSTYYTLLFRGTGSAIVTTPTTKGRAYAQIVG